MFTWSIVLFTMQPLFLSEFFAHYFIAFSNNRMQMKRGSSTHSFADVALNALRLIYVAHKKWENRPFHIFQWLKWHLKRQQLTQLHSSLQMLITTLTTCCDFHCRVRLFRSYFHAASQSAAEFQSYVKMTKLVIKFCSTEARNTALYKVQHHLFSDPFWITSGHRYSGLYDSRHIYVHEHAHVHVCTCTCSCK